MAAAVLEVSNVLVAEFTAPPLHYSCASSPAPTAFTNLTSQLACEAHRATLQGVQQDVECQHFVFNTTVFASTVTADLELVCERSWYRSLHQMVLTLGCTVGALTGGVFTDLLGRQRSLFYGALLMTTFTLVVASAPSLLVLLPARFLLGVSMHLVLNPAITMGNAYFGLKLL
ncbi:solute carrier family 22 member 16-like [Hyalella azteca]|uniref:Solute carrier family 22 member 16-like n=1 Tax=Hyalella azteca TaxID=294128 RepID=A0A979FSF2_HYAAZ|nr:solute carrier family 22 member 16-like [Hyalella azteca]